MNITLVNIIDYFIFEKLKETAQPQELWLYRCFCGIVLFISFIVLMAMPLQIFGFFSSDFKPGLVIALMFTSLFLFRQKGYFSISVNLLCLFIFIILAPDIINNGLILSRGNFFFVLIPIIAFIFCGTRYGLIWMGIISIFLIVLFLESTNAINYFPASLPKTDPAFCLVVYLQALSLILGLIFIISRSKSMAIEQLAINEEHLRQKAYELEVKTEELEDLKSELVIRNENLSKYAAVTAHDLKQPLRTITSFAELLKMQLQDNENSEVQEYLNFIISGGVAMKDQVDKVLDIANLSNEIVFSPLDTKEVIQHTLRMLYSQIESSNAKVEIKDIPSKIIANEVSIKKVFQNLISNGIKFNNNGAIKIEISGIETPNEWQFLVKDNGSGMKEEVQHKIFNFGERATSEKEGTGIGLNICKKLINLHRGKIWVNSKQEIGSEFFFSINKNLQSI